MAGDWRGLDLAPDAEAPLGWVENVKQELARNFAGCLVRPVASIAEKLLEKVLTYVCGFR